MPKLLRNFPEGAVAVPFDSGTVFGREPGAGGIVVDDARASRRHCKLESDGAQWRLTDLESSNGTRVNGVPVNVAWLADGDRIEIGAAIFVWQAEANDPAADPIRPADAKDRLRAAHRGGGVSRLITVVVAIVVMGGVWYVYDKKSREADAIAAVVGRHRRAAESALAADRLDAAKRELEMAIAATDDEATLVELRRLLQTTDAKAGEAARDQAEFRTLTEHHDAYLGAGRRARLEALVKRTSDLSLQVAARARLDADDAATATACADTLRAARAAAEEALVALKFKEASLAFTAAEKTAEAAGRDDAQRDVRVARQGIADRIRKHLDAARRQAEEALIADKPKEAVEVLEAAWKALAGTAHEGEAQAALKTMRSRAGEYAIDRQAPTSQAVAGGEKLHDRADRAHAARAEAETLSAGRAFAAAAEKFDEASPGLWSPQERLRCERRARVLRAAARLRTAAVEASSEGKISGSVDFASTRARVESIDDEAIRLKLGESGSAVWRWKDAPGDRLLAVLALVATTPEQKLDLAAATYLLGDKVLAEQRFAKASEEATLKGAADSLWSDCIEKPIPDGGFVALGNRFVDPDAAATERRRIHARDLGETLKTAPQKEAVAIAEQLRSLQEDGLAALSAGLEARSARQAAEIEKHGRCRDAEGARRDCLEALLAARRTALALIFDEQKYPYPYAPNQSEVQAEVDRLVQDVRTIWVSPLEHLAAKDPSLAALIAEARETEQWLTVLGSSSRRVAMTIGKIEARIDLRGGAIEGALQKAVADVELHNASRREVMTPEELEVHRLVNEYRLMMGARPLKIDGGLARAARGHSEEMKTLGYFAHGSPTKGRETPGQRCKLEGFSGPVGENIAQGQSDALGAFRSWTHSSGHHRNILTPGWTALGVGKSLDALYWTQNFGTGASLERPANGGKTKDQNAH